MLPDYLKLCNDIDKNWTVIHDNLITFLEMNIFYEKKSRVQHHVLACRYTNKGNRML